MTTYPRFYCVCFITGTGEITIELCKESSFATPEEMNKDGTELYSAYMYKLTNSVLNIWKKRWFVLKSDNCLYYYKNQTVYFCFYMLSSL